MKNHKELVMLLGLVSLAGLSLAVSYIAVRREEARLQKDFEELEASMKYVDGITAWATQVNDYLDRAIETATFWDIVTREQEEEA